MNTQTTDTSRFECGRDRAPTNPVRPGSETRITLAIVLQCALLMLAGLTGTAHAQAELVDDINTGFSPGGGSTPLRFMRIGPLSFFRACDRPHGCELWQSDGTADGTRLVADICAGPCSSEPDNLMASREGALFFSADDGAHGREPWVHEPLPFASPTMLVDANPGALSSDPSSFVQTVTGSVSTRVHFVARNSAVEGAELRWFSARHLGAAWVIAPVMAAGVNVGRAVAEGDRLFYRARIGDEGEKLVMMRPLASGTSQTYLDIRPDTGSAGIDQLIAVPDLGGVFFRADNGIHGDEPWFSDGTQAVTRMIADLAPGATGSAVREPVAYGGRVYFLANDRNGGDSHDLWGTTLTLTQKIRNHPTSAATGLAVLGDQMIYVASESASGREFWRSNGTFSGTAQVVDLIPGPEGLGNPEGAAIAGGYYYFGAGPQLYRTNGTAAGTRAIGPASIISLTFNGELHGRPDGVMYAGYVDGQGYELFASFIATPTQAAPVTLIEPAIGDSDPMRFLGLAAGKVMFAYNEDAYALRRINPAGGTDVLMPGGIDLGSARMTRDAPHHLFFRRFSGEQLWRSDGSPAGTGMLLELAQAPFNISRIECIVPVTANEAYLLVEIASEFALLRTDGTADGTTMLLAPGMLPSSTRLTFSSCPAVLGNSIVFAAFRDGIGRELFRNNGTPGHIALVRDIAPGPDNGMLIFQEKLLVAHDRLWFAADASGTGANIEPWVSDGTAQGTFPLGDFNEQGSSRPHSFTAFAFTPPEVGLRQGVMFAARTETSGHLLMFSDGSPAGTLSIAMPSMRGEAVSLQSSEAFGPAVVAAGTDLFFAVTLHTTGGAHLAHLSGTTFTARVITPLGASAPVAPQHMAGFDGGVMFSGHSAGGGRELWYSDGTDAGTFAATDIDPGANSAGPLDIAVLGDGVYFAAEDGVSGREPWRLPLPRPETIFADGFE